MSGPAKRGCFISLEGIEGVGKSTQGDIIAEWLRSHDVDVVQTREPGGTEFAEKIRALLLSGEGEAPTATTELLLMFGARAQHVETLIRPSLKAGRWVLCDRFTDATLAYQGAGRGLDRQTIMMLAELCHADCWPDLTLLFDMSPEASLRRRHDRDTEDRIEAEASEFFARARDGYLSLVAAEPARVKRIDADQSLRNVTEQCLSYLEPLLKDGASN